MKKLIIRISLGLISVAVIWGTVVSLQPAPSTMDELMESLVDPGLKIRIRTPYSGTVLVAKKGEIIFHKAYGESNRDTHELNKIDTKFGIGSVTKQFTAMLVMQLVEKGQLNLEDTIAQYLPYMPKEMGDKITIHQLLSHTAGLAHYNGLQAIGISLSEFGNMEHSPHSFVQLIGKTNFINTPGEAYSYSSLGYDLLGAILEEVSGKTYAVLLDESIAKPLGLKNTGFGTNEFVATELAKGYRYQEEYGFAWFTAEHGGTTTEAPFRDQSTAFSTGGVHSTVEDLFIWSEAIKANTLLSPELTKKMLTPNKHGYCYGWVRNWDDIVEQNTGVQLYGHGGALSGNSAFIAVYDDETTIIYLANRANVKPEVILHHLHLLANNLEDTHKLTGYPDRSNYDSFVEAGGMPVLQDYFNRLSEYSGYKVHPSRHSMSGVMQIHLEADKKDIADSLKNAFLTLHNPDESTLNKVGYLFLFSDTPLFALEFFKENTRKYPFSSNAWDSLGEAYLVTENHAMSIECYTKAVEIAQRVSHPMLPLYRENLKKAEAKS